VGKVDQFMRASFENEDRLLDVPFVTEDGDTVLLTLISVKSPGHDELQAEHLKYGGTILWDWILQICGAIIEHVPDSPKTGIIIPVYKGGGKDTLDCNSYRGIYAYINANEHVRIITTCTERGIPHIRQPTTTVSPVQKPSFPL
jgi:hypothetical protein